MSDYAASIPCGLAHCRNHLCLAGLVRLVDIAKLIPYLSVHMNTGFYLVFSTVLLIRDENG